MWDLSKPSSSAASAEPVQVKDVLYEYDGPAIFTSTAGFADLLFSKADQLEDGSLFLVNSVTSETLDALLKGKLSVRGAISAPDITLAHLSHDLRVIRYWNCRLSEIPPDLLPENGAGLYELFGVVADTLEQSTSFFSMRFSGISLSQSSMPLSTFRTLVNEATDAIRRILTPTFLLGNRSHAVDFSVSPPIFGSLVISVKDPIIDASKLDDDHRNQPSIESEMIGEVRQNRDSFFGSLEQVVTKARDGELTETFAREHFVVLDQIRDLIPSEEDTNIESVQFSGLSGSQLFTVAIDEEIGGRMRRGHKIAETTNVTERGTIAEINAPSASFILQSTRGRSVTCKFKPEVFRQLRARDEFKIGARIVVEGLFTRRPNRDLLHADNLPRIILGAG